MWDTGGQATSFLTFAGFHGAVVGYGPCRGMQGLWGKDVKGSGKIPSDITAGTRRSTLRSDPKGNRYMKASVHPHVSAVFSGDLSDG